MRFCKLPLVLCAFLTGCTLQSTSVPSPTIVTGAALNGTVHGGSQPIANAKVYLLTPNNFGLPSSSSGSLSLLTQAQTGNAPDAIGSYVLTGSDGSFSVSGDYSCTVGVPVTGGATVTLPGNEQLYLYIAGGNPGGPNSPANTSIALMATLGPCNSPLAHVSVNEVTTVATAYALAGWAYDPLHVSAPSVGLGNISTVALSGLDNAFANASLLANMTTGTANSTLYNGEGLAPAATVNTIANILASCVNGATGNTNCTTLFQYTELSPHYFPTNTAQVPILLAQYPTSNSQIVNAILNLQPAIGAPYPGLSTAPQNFMLPLEFAIGNIISGANTIAIDASGNAWIANQTAVLGLSAAGQNLAAPFSTGFNPGSIFSQAQNLAVDQQGHIWVSDSGAKELFELSSSGSLLSTVNSVPAPGPIAIDSSGNLWVGDTQNAAIDELNNTGSLTNTYSLGTFGAPQTIALSRNPLAGNYSVWATPASSSLGQVAELTFSSGANGTETLSQRTGFTRPTGIVFDLQNNPWISDSTANQLVEIPSGGSSYTTYTGFSAPSAMTADSAGQIWVLNSGNSAIALFNTTNESTPGFSNTLLKNPLSLAIDSSGSIWVVQPASVLEFLGTASPLMTPAANAVSGPDSTP